MLLQTHENKNPEDIETEAKQQSCPTCGKKFFTKADLNKHRPQAEQCAKKWDREKPTRNTCAIRGRNRTFTTQEQLRNHEHQHIHNKKYRTIYNLDPGGKLDRRK